MLNCPCASLIKHHAMKTYGEWRCTTTILETGTSDGELSASWPCHFTPGKEPQPLIPIIQDARWGPEPVCLELNPGHPAPSPDTELSQFIKNWKWNLSSSWHCARLYSQSCILILNEQFEEYLKLHTIIAAPQIKGPDTGFSTWAFVINLEWFHMQSGGQSCISLQVSSVLPPVGL
jgi:hypothetical protein